MRLLTLEKHIVKIVLTEVRSPTMQKSREAAFTHEFPPGRERNREERERERERKKKRREKERKREKRSIKKNKEGNKIRAYSVCNTKQGKRDRRAKN